MTIMKSKSRIICGYIDYKMIGEAEMHNRDWRKVKSSIIESLEIKQYATSYMFLTTCLRFEVFLETSNPSADRVLKKHDMNVIVDIPEIFLRIVKIAIGLESTILGERAIFNQIKHAKKISNISVEYDLNSLLDESFDYATKIREKYSFYNPHSYGTIGAKLLFSSSKNIHGVGIIGAGSMVKDFLSITFSTIDPILDRGTPVLLANRTLSTIQDLARHYKLHATTVRLNQIEEVIKNASHIYIATQGTVFSSETLHALQEKRIVDVCFPSIVKNTDNHLTIIHPTFLDEIERSNDFLNQVKDDVLNELMNFKSTIT